MEALKDYVRLLHVPTLLLLALMQLAVYIWVIVPYCEAEHFISPMGYADLTLLIMATVMIAAGGFVINDYFDLKIDQINRPLTRVVGKRIEKKSAMHLYMVLTGIGMIFAGWLCYRASNSDYLFFIQMDFFIFIALVGLLWFYSSVYKRMLWLGNLMVSAMMALVPMLVVLFFNNFLKSIYSLTPDIAYMGSNLLHYVSFFSVMAFGWTFIIEVVKDMASEKGDRELECHTFPVVYGTEKSKWIVYAAIVVLCGWLGYKVYDLELLHNSLSIQFFLCGIVLPAMSVFYILSKAENYGDFRLVTRYLFVIFVINVFYTYVFSQMSEMYVN